MNFIMPTIKLIFALVSTVGYFIVGLFSPVIISFSVNMLNLARKGYKITKFNSVWKQEGILKRLVISFPKQLAKDIFTRDPNKYPYFGTILFCGGQGSGKTISMVYLSQKIKKKYPQSLSFANFTVMTDGDSLVRAEVIKKENPLDPRLVPEFDGWADIVENNNGEFGVTFLIDEISIWFNNRDSRNFPPTLLQDLNQQRKQRKMTIGTAQRFGLIVKDIRAIPEYVYLPKTLFGCITFVLVSRPELWDNEKNRFKKYELFKTWFFVHTPELRNSYDTFQRIQRTAKEGLVPNEFISGSKGISPTNE
jgi:hypothetical protein